MDVFFGDDAVQEKPLRDRMGSLVATGGIYVNGDQVQSLERSLNFICSQFKFPKGERFKWSPNPAMWMHKGLVDPDRHAFFEWVLRTCADHHAEITVVISDTDGRLPRGYRTHTEYVTAMLLERVDWQARGRTSVIVIVDRPGGGRGEERAFLAHSLVTLQTGTGYVVPAHIAINPVATDSAFIRLLQAADLVTSCVTAHVAGLTRLAPALLPMVKPLLHRASHRVGGIGVKIVPEYWYGNLYHWLFEDSHFWRANVGHPLPFKGWPYEKSADVFK